MLVSFYIQPSGRSPVEDFIKKLPKADRARTFDVISGIEQFGFGCPRVQFKPLRGKLWEIKYKAKSGGYRLLYVVVEENNLVILHAFKKKTQKAPLKEIDIAEKRMKEVLK